MAATKDLAGDFATLEQNEQKELASQVDLLHRRRKAVGQGYGKDATAWDIALTQRLDIETGAFCRYICFVVLFTFSALSTRDAYYGYAYRQLVEETVLGEEFLPQDTVIAKSFDDIESIDDVWMFLNGPFLRHMYNEVSYTGEPLPPVEQRLVLGQSKLIGRVRFSQVRVRADGCTVPSAFRDETAAAYIPHCYPPWSIVSPELHDKAPILGYDPLTACAALEPDATVPVLGEALPCNDTSRFETMRSYSWTDAAVTGQGVFMGEFNTYGGGSYFVDLPNAQSEVATLLAEMQEDDFFDVATRAAWLDFTVYNANVNRFLVVRLLFEQLSSGGVWASADLRSLHLLWYAGDDWLIQLGPEVGLLFFIVLYILVEFYEMKRLGRAYLKDAWNWWDWACIACLVGGAVCRYQQFRGMRAVTLKLQASIDSFLNFRSVAVYADLELNLMSLTTLTLNVKVLKFLKGVPRLNGLLNTLGRARNQLVAFSLGFAILMVAFSTAYNLAFGTQLYEWRSVGHSMMSLLHFMLGDVDPLRMRKDNWVLGPLLYVAFLFFMVLVLINMFLAIIADSYAFESRLVDQNVQMSIVMRQAFRRQAGRVCSAFGKPGKRLAERIVPPPPPAADDEGGGGGDTVVEEGFIEMAMQGVKQRVLDGHLNSVGDAATQLKAMCFRQDSKVLPLREPLQAVLTQLEELRRVNRQLRMHALGFGWEWDSAAQQLVVSRSRKATAKALQAEDGIPRSGGGAGGGSRRDRTGALRRHRQATRSPDPPLTATDREEEFDEDAFFDDDELDLDDGGVGTGACASAVKFAAKASGGGRRKRQHTKRNG